MASRRITPTPDNYRRHYEEIAGPYPASPTEVERMLKQLATDPRAQARNHRACSALERAAAEGNWARCRTELLELIAIRNNENFGAGQWAHIIVDLVAQLEARHKSLTTAKKRDCLQRVLAAPVADAAELAQKLRKLIAYWAAAAREPSAVTVASADPESGRSEHGPEGKMPVAATDPCAAIAATDTAGGFAQMRELLAQTLEFAVASQLGHAPELAEEATALAKSTREACDEDAIEKLTSALRRFWYRLELRGGGDAEMHKGLLRLLRLLIDNTQDLVGDDQWMKGQVAALQEIISRPLDLAAIESAERRFKEVIFKQEALKTSLRDAKTALKQLISSFIDRLGGLSEATGVYHDRLEDYAQKIRQTDDIGQLNTVLGDLLRDTRTAQIDAARSRDELISARRQVEATETKVKKLERELAQVSELVQEDQLTGVLNRRGLDGAFAREAARGARADKPMCVGLLDIDNFKALNDTHGHQTGDEALQHLVRVTRRTMRPSDIIARYGGEEFLLVLPETQLDEAVAVMARLQRNLTKAFFMHNNERVLITFSAGVAQRQGSESQSEIINRADQALYLAKRSGKNRVCAA